MLRQAKKSTELWMESPINGNYNDDMRGLVSVPA